MSGLRMTVTNAAPPSGEPHPGAVYVRQVLATVERHARASKIALFVAAGGAVLAAAAEVTRLVLALKGIIR